jgi:hypothetical protein
MKVSRAVTEAAMGDEQNAELTFETMLTDPLIRLVMDSDGVTAKDLADVMLAVRESRGRCQACSRS